MNINFLTAYSHEQGTYFRWHNIGLGLKSLGHNVRVYCVDYRNEAVTRTELRDGLTYHIVAGAKGQQYLGTINNPFTAFKRLFVAYEPCDVLHVFQPFLATYIPWRYKLKNISKITIFDWDDLWIGGFYRNKPLNKNLVEKWNYGLTEYFEKKIPSNNYPMTTCSLLLKNLAHERGAKVCSIFHNGFWSYEKIDLKKAREKLNLKQDVVYVGFMGRTTDELKWCFEAVEKCTSLGISVRFALCGSSVQDIQNINSRTLELMDYLGDLTPIETRVFASAINLGLLPLEDNTFNNSRFPIKLSEYMAAGIPVLCSEVGEMKHYVEKYSWVLSAGKNKKDWIDSFVNAVKQLNQNCDTYKVDREVIEKDLSWMGISKKVEEIYKNLQSKQQ